VTEPRRAASWRRVVGPGSEAEPAAGPGPEAEPAAGPGRALARRWATDPLVPMLVLAPAAVLAAARAPVLTWAMVGGLAGYALSGSV
jgi:hypothetical protein